MAKYVKKGETEMSPWTPETNMDGVSISDEDKNNGSPKQGDMIATGDEPTDRWLVAQDYFEKNYKAVDEG